MKTFNAKAVFFTVLFAIAAVLTGAVYFATPVQAGLLGGGIATCSLDVTDTVIAPGETATISYELSGGAYDLSVNNGVGALSGTSGTFEVSPVQTTSYTGTYLRELLGTETQGICGITIYVEEESTPEPKTCDISASADTVRNGDNVTITWDASGYDVVELNGEAVSNDGSKTFRNITEDVTYTLYATTDDGKNVCNNTVEINCLPPANVDPQCTLTPESATIEEGESVLLEWTTKNAETVTLEPGFGSVAANDSQSVSPANNTLYTLTATDVDGDSVQCHADITVTEQPTPAPTCTLTANPTELGVGGGSVTLDWTSTNADTIELNNGIGAVNANDTLTVDVTDDITYILTVDNADHDPVQCPVTITVDDPTPTPKATINAQKIVCTDESQLPNWGAGGPDITSQTASNWVAQNGSCSFASNWKFQWAPDGASDPGDSFVGEAGGDWTTFGPASANGVASVQIPLANTTDRIWLREVLQTDYIPFTYGSEGDQNTNDISAEFYCHNDVLNYDNREHIGNLSEKTYHCVAWNVPVEQPTPAPTCTLTANPTQLGVGGGDVLLEWTSSNADTIELNNGIGSVLNDEDKKLTVNVTDDIQYVLTVDNADNDPVECPVTITVDDPTPTYSCEDNVIFTASDANIDEGDSTTITWDTIDVTDLSFVSGINSTALSGDVNVSPNSDTTYRMDVTFVDGSTDQCALNINVDEDNGGGGGGSNSPRCELEVSDDEVDAGDTVDLIWESSRASDVIIEDDEGEIIMTTEDYLSDEKDEFYDGRAEIEINRDTTFYMLAVRGSRDDECDVSVDVTGGGGGVVVEDEPRGSSARVAGIALSQVPYTGFEAGPLLTTLFFTLLTLWALFVAYVLVIKRNRLAGFRLGGIGDDRPYEDMSVPAASPQESSVAADYVASSTPATQSRSAAPSEVAPGNLPTGDLPFSFGPSSEATPTEAMATSPAVGADDSSDMAELENYAHERRVLLSGDALRFFIEACPEEISRTQFMERVISAARVQFPTEDGWLVLNYSRMKDLCAHTGKLQATPQEALGQPAWTHHTDEDSRSSDIETPTSRPNTDAPAAIAEGTGSLAEAIVSGNVTAAYQMIGHRPMIALADAATDLDAVYRTRKGEAANVSTLLEQSVSNLTDQQITEAIEALTGALDGVYQDEVSAVKMAIMKAIKALS